MLIWKKMVNTNYKNALSKVKDPLIRWDKRQLTPFGKVTIIKTFILSKFNHLFSALPSPSSELIKQIESLMFAYIWSHKPDKISRDIMTMDYRDGGVKMINLKSYIMSSTFVSTFKQGIIVEHPEHLFYI